MVPAALTDALPIGADSFALSRASHAQTIRSRPPHLRRLGHRARRRLRCRYSVFGAPRRELQPLLVLGHQSRRPRHPGREPDQPVPRRQEPPAAQPLGPSDGVVAVEVAPHGQQTGTSTTTTRHHRSLAPHSSAPRTADTRVAPGGRTSPSDMQPHSRPSTAGSDPRATGRTSRTPGTPRPESGSRPMHRVGSTGRRASATTWARTPLRPPRRHRPRRPRRARRRARRQPSRPNRRPHRARRAGSEPGPQR